MWLLLACTTPPTEPAPEPAPPPPDIVLVVVDTLRGDHLGFMGHPRPTSPNLDALAAQGTVYANAMAHSGWTLPATASLLSGALPHQHRAVSLAVDGPSAPVETSFGRLSETVETLAEAASRHGYATGAFVNNTFLQPGSGLERGFSTYDYQPANPVQHRSAEATVDQALAWWEAQSSPRLLWVHVMEPHMDYAAPEPYRGRFTEGPTPLPDPMTDEARKEFMENPQVVTEPQKAWLPRAYDEEILATDAALGRLLEGVQGSVVAFTSDHGEEFWEHGAFEHGHSLHWEVLHVPMLLVGPDIPVQRVPELSSHLDLHAALLRAMGGGSAWQPLPAGRTLVAEDCLHSDPQVAVVTDTARLHVNLETQDASLWSWDGQRETLWNDKGARDQVAGPLFEALMTQRGSLERSVGQPFELTDEDRERLKALGYLDE